MSAWPQRRDAQHYLAGQELPSAIKRKSRMALELNMSRDRFRLLLRKLELTVAGFFTGSSKSLTPAQQVVIRQYVREQLSTPALFPNP